MQSIELTAKSVDEAKATAAQKFGVSPNDVQVTVIEETKGLFGKTNVRVRAEVDDALVAPAPAPTPRTVYTPPAPTEAAPEPVAVVAAPVAAEEAPAAAPKQERTPRGRSRKPEGEAAENGEGEGEDNQVVATQEDVDQLLGLVNEILQSGELAVTAQASATGGRYVNVEIDGKDVAFLVGKHGEVLNALQYLVNIAAARKFANGVRITLDGNNYRERREAALTALATKIAEEVRNRREEAVLDALPAFERRVVHKALASIEGVETYSEGEEPNRRVVIAPVEA